MEGGEWRVESGSGISIPHSPPSTLHPPRWSKVALWILIILFSVYFTALAFNLHAAHRTHMADL